MRVASTHQKQICHRGAAGLERRWRQIRKDTGYEWVTPHTFRKTVATLTSEATTSELASRQLGHSSSQVTRDHYIAKPPVSADLSVLLERLAQKDERATSKRPIWCPTSKPEPAPTQRFRWSEPVFRSG